MALFGAPITHEDHALRACYAALAMQAALRTYAEEVRCTHGPALQSRIGLNSGEVVVRTIHNGLHMDYSAVGQTTHLAARMEQSAPPDTILLTAATMRLVEELVRVKALGPLSIRGLAVPVEAFELLGASGIRRRLQAATARGLTRFVGRQMEMAALQAALARAGAGHGQVVAVVGEAGMGKSRLVDEFVQATHTQGWLVLDSAAVSYGKATPYFPIRDLLRRYCHLEEREDTHTIQTKVTAQVQTLDAALQDTLPAFLGLLDALPAESPFLQLDAPQRRQRTLLALKRVLLRESQVQPLLLVCEDLHWLDTEAQALLDSLIESLPTARFLLLVNYRPDYRHSWGSKPYYTQLRLDPLPLVSADAFLRTLLGDDPSLAPLTRLLIERTEGNPFFLEESVRTLVETGALVGEPGAYRVAQALPTMQMPATVQAVFVRAQLARCHADLSMFTEGRTLGEEGLRIAEGADHPASLMFASHGIGMLALRQGDLPRALPLLEQAVGLCHEADLPAYFPLTAAALGMAYTLGRRSANAVPLLTQAIEQAIAMERGRYQALCRLAMGEVHLLLGRLEEAHTLAERALALTHMQKERGNQAYALCLLGDIAAHRTPPESELAKSYYGQALALAEELGMRPLQAHCHRGLGTLYSRVGRLDEARTVLSTALHMYRAMEMALWLPQVEATLAQTGGRAS